MEGCGGKLQEENRLTVLPSCPIMNAEKMREVKKCGDNLLLKT